MEKERVRRKESISVVIPAYNESGRIVGTVRRIGEYCVENFESFEIIVVDDGSKDETREIVVSEARNISGLRCEGYQKNRGKGYAIRHGVLSAFGELILVSDADLSTPIEELEKMLPRIYEGCQIVIGSRALEDSAVLVRQPWWRQSMGRTFNLFVRLLFSVDFRDTQCGFKLFERSCAKRIFAAAEIDRFAYDVEIIHLARKAGFRIAEVPVKWVNSPASKVDPLKDSLQMLKDLIRIKLRG